jgi:hypothetical protein
MHISKDATGQVIDIAAKYIEGIGNLCTYEVEELG